MNYTNPTNLSSAVAVINYVDSVTQGWFGIGILLTMGVIAVASLQDYPEKKTALITAYFASIIGFLLFLMGVLKLPYLLISCTIYLISILYISMKKSA